MTRPTGTVTLLFTDVVGSTAAWEREPDAMAGALARHDALLRGCVEQAGGVVFKTVGDAVCAAFGDAQSGLMAAATAARALADEPWPTAGPLSVRMALNSGTCEERDGDYFGPTVNRVARLVAVANGDQILCARATADLVTDALPSGCSLHSLGSHRLRDLAREEEIFQVNVEGLPDTFPPLRSLSNPALSHNLPVQLTSFVGREVEIEKVCRLVEHNRLVTITGPGGCGKTRLSLHVAANLLDASDDGVWFVDLAPLREPSEVAPAVAQVLEVREAPPEPVEDTIVRKIGSKSMLLVLDNCEHLVDAVAKFVDQLLRQCDNLRVLATSRELLGIDGEHVAKVPPLSMPPDAKADIETLMHYEAIRLFVERASAHESAFALDTTNASSVVEICRRLDGIPLAIELAAARARSMSVRELVQRLSHRFQLLTGGARTATARQRTLEATIEWSYELLGPSERSALERLSVFVGQFDLAAAEAVASQSEDDPIVVDVIGALVDRSLVQLDTLEDETWYRLLESVRDYAAHRLVDSGEDKVEQAQDRHARHYASIWMPYDLHDFALREDPKWRRCLDLQHDDTVAAVRHVLSRQQFSDDDAHFCIAISNILGGAGEYRLSAGLARELEPRFDQVTSLFLQTLIQHLMASTYYNNGEWSRSVSASLRAVELSEQLGDDFETAAGLFALSTGLIDYVEDRELIAKFYQRLTRLIEESEDKRAVELSRFARALCTVQSNPETALREATDALDYFESTGEESMARGLRVDLSLIEMEAGSLDRARALTQSCLDQLDDNSSMYSRLCLYLNMSMIESLLGNDRSAARYCSQSIRVVNDHAVLGSQSGTLVTEAVVLVGLGFDEDAARVHGTCSAMIERGHGALDRFERRIDERSVDRLRERLGEEVVLQLEAEGRTWSFEQASARTDEALVAFLGAGSA